MEAVTLKSNMGDIVGDLEQKKGQVDGMDDRNGAKVIKATVLCQNVLVM